MNNKKNFVFWRKLTGDLVEDNFLKKPEYHAFFDKCNKHFNFRIAYDRSSYLGKGIFRDVFIYQSGKFLPAEKKFKADVIYQYKKLTNDTFDNAIPILDSQKFKDWCPDKWNQYKLLEKFMPKSFLIKKEGDIQKYLKKINTSKAVLKPRRGEKGENIIVFEKTKLPQINQTILETKGYVLQEFYDTNIIVPRIVSGTHDIKLITIGENIFPNLRTPEKGKEICTYDSPYTEIDLKKLPKKVFNFHKKIKEKIDLQFPSQVYTIDIGITKKGPILFELNSHTAFPYLNFKYAQKFFDALINCLDSLSKKKK